MLGVYLFDVEKSHEYYQRSGDGKIVLHDIVPSNNGGIR